MSNALESSKMSDMIYMAMQEIINRTEDFMRSVEDKSAELNMASIMIKGPRRALSRGDYDLLKSQRCETKQRMKVEIKALCDDFKANRKRYQPE